MQMEVKSREFHFYGRSFITDNTGEIIAEAKDGTDIILSSKIDVEANRATRAAWGLFRDRRPELVWHSQDKRWKTSKCKY